MIYVYMSAKGHGVGNHSPLGHSPFCSPWLHAWRPIPGACAVLYITQRSIAHRQAFCVMLVALSHCREDDFYKAHPKRSAAQSAEAGVWATVVEQGKGVLFSLVRGADVRTWTKLEVAEGLLHRLVSLK